MSGSAPRPFTSHEEPHTGRRRRCRRARAVARLARARHDHTPLERDAMNKRQVLAVVCRPYNLRCLSRTQRLHPLFTRAAHARRSHAGSVMQGLALFTVPVLHT